MAFTADRRLYLSVDKSRVIEEGDSEAAFLFCSAGEEISKEDAKTLGLDFRDGKVVVPGGKDEKEPAPQPAPEPEPDEKAAPKPEDKAARKSEDKKVAKEDAKKKKRL